MLTKLYRKYVSQEVRNKIYDIFLGGILFFFRNFSENIKAKSYYYFRWFLSDTEKNRCYIFMGKHKLMPLPYPFRLEYSKIDVDCQFDEKYGMFFVNHFGNKLYFSKSLRKKEVINKYQQLTSEQDPRSPHQYVKDINQLQGKILLDIGAAEAMFSLDAINSVKKVYLFECKQEWIDALKLTFASWENKVEIINKYVSDSNDENNITIDHFLERKEKESLFLKMDIEGYEQAALRGAVKTFRDAQDIDFSITTYHKKNDEQKIAEFLQHYNLEYEQTEGYFFCLLKGNKGLRRAIIRSKTI
ncbi:MAG: FkbM family methyltransferase [Bacteroidales bacterium]|jgi:hypothetical protein|nr:FkbM family methyltransferase [Bacteroidales bacterium]